MMANLHGEMNEMRENEGNIISIHGNDDYVGMEGDKGEGKEAQGKGGIGGWQMCVCGIA